MDAVKISSYALIDADNDLRDDENFVLGIVDFADILVGRDAVKIFSEKFEKNGSKLFKSFFRILIKVCWN